MKSVDISQGQGFSACDKIKNLCRGRPHRPEKPPTEENPQGRKNVDNGL